MNPTITFITQGLHTGITLIFIPETTLWGGVKPKRLYGPPRPSQGHMQKQAQHAQDRIAFEEWKKAQKML